MRDAIDTLLNTIDNHKDLVGDVSNFTAFEPWDLPERPSWQYDLAIEDGVDLRSVEHTKLFGTTPNLFQSGIVFSDKKLSLTIAASQVGKSFPELMRLICSASGEFPYSMRYPRGVDTKVPRVISVENVRRFGRRDSVTGKIIDYDETKIAEYLRGNREWNCGTIIGVGKFPDKLVAPDGAKFWIGTTRRAYIEMWLPKLNIENKENCIIPAHMVDTNRGNKGYSAINQMVHLKRGIDISFITYESGPIKFEARRVFRIALDEEPPNREIFAAAMSHCESMSIITTPYRGVTWLKEIIDKPLESKDIWHCTQYDSPYQVKSSVDAERASYLPHQRAARCWGVPVVQNEDRPFFHPLKINLWMQRHKPRYQLTRFSATQRYGSIKPDYESSLACLMDVPIKAEKTDKEDSQYAWRMYEDVKKGEAYALIADPAEGDEIPEDAGDAAAAIVVRLPKTKTRKDEFGNEIVNWPQPVALIRSTLLCEQFAEMCLYVARYYNNATLAPESYRRAAWNALFYGKTKTYPYWFYHDTERWSTRKRRGTPGFDTNAKTRDLIFKKVQDWEDSFTEDEPPNFFDDMLLEEMAGCILNKKGRPDHVTRGKLDLTVCWGIALYIASEYPEQFKDNSVVSDEEEEETFLGKIRGMQKPKDEFYEWQQFRT